MAVVTIGGLTAAAASDMDDTVLFEVEDNDSASRKATLAQVRTALNAQPITITSTTTPQFTVRYDASNHVTVSVASNGATTFNSTGAGAGFTFSDGVTVSSGTTALQAVTTTTIAPTGPITSSATNGIFVGSGATTSARYADFTNTGGRTLVGTENSTGATMVSSGGVAYSTVLASVGSLPIIFAPNQVKRMTIGVDGDPVVIAIPLNVNGSAQNMITVTSSNTAVGVDVDSTHASAAGGFFRAKQGGAYRALFGVSGVWLGSTASDTAVASYNGSVQFYTNGSGTLRGEFPTAGGFTIPAGTSAFQAVTATTLTTTSTIAAGAGSNIEWTGRSVMESPSDGVIRFTNNAESDFSRLQFGGTTSSFPAIKRNGADLELRLADDSGRTNLILHGLTAHNGITVSSGTSAFQAATGTTWTGTGQIKTTVTTQQLSLNYDASNHLAVTVASDGATTYNATGAGATHTFSDPVTVTGLLTVSSGDILIGATQKLRLDGSASGDTYIAEVSGNVVRITAGGNTAASFSSTQSTFALIASFTAGLSTADVILTANSSGAAFGQVGLTAETQTTVGAAGAASALPANPLGYWIINVGGTEVAVPYYNKA